MRMDSMILAASVVIPLMIYMLVGVIAQKWKVISRDNLRAVNKMVFQILIPLALFFDIYHADIKDAFRPKEFAFVFVSVLTVFFVLYVVVSKYVKEPSDAATIIQGTYRSNFVLFGGTIAASLCNAEGCAMFGALSAMVIPMFNILAVILFEVKRGGKVKVKKILFNILKNPLVDAGVLGALCSAFHIQFPVLLADTLETLGDIATPLALVALGGLLSFESIKNHRTYLIATALGRLCIVPAVILGIAVLLGFRGDSLVAILAIFASPTAVASGPMAQALGGNGALAGEIIVSTSALCIVTFFVFLTVLSGMGMI